MAENGRQRGDDKLLLGLATGLSIRAAAKRAKLSERTVYRRLQDSEFRRQVSQIRGTLIDAAVGKLADAATAAVDTLVKLLSADADSVRLGACRSILELGTKLRESTEIEQRISELEQRTNGEPQNPN